MADELWIEIIAHGPYRVHGDIPLSEMAPVHTFNGEPVDWHTLRRIEAPPGGYDLCRCGKTSTRPFCDTTHEKVRFDGKETASRLPYRERAESWERNDEILSDDQPLCFSAGFCGTRTRNIWDMFAESNDPDELQLMREMVFRCPSGRIVLSDHDGFPKEQPLEPAIAVLPGGPIWVRGGITIIGTDGTPWEPRNRVTVCRCGRSRNKPYCDGTHMRIHFDER
jgi:CDGSH-type Zn-finger protein